ncbi:hypothetical protein D3C71_1795690 [compost metagenome]
MARQPLNGDSVRVLSEHGDGARRWFGDPGDQLHQGGFARTIVAYQCDALTFVDG